MLNNAMYATFEHNGTIKEHFIGIVPLSKLVGASLSAPNVFQVIQDFFRSIDISFPVWYHQRKFW